MKKKNRAFPVGFEVKVQELADQSLTCSEIGRRLKVDIEKLRAWANRKDVNIKFHKSVNQTTICRNNDALVRKMALDNKSAIQIADKIKVTFDVMNHYLSNNKIKTFGEIQLLKNREGERLGKLTILHRIGVGSKFECLCDCGKKVKRSYEALTNNLKRGNSISCGCVEKIHKKIIAKNERRVGEKWNRLTIIDFERNVGKQGQLTYVMICKCDCGNITRQLYVNLKKSIVVSCSCYHKELTSELASKLTHFQNVKYKFNHKGQHMRSSYEVIYAEYLDKIGIRWEYEPKNFKLKPAMTYKPDFYLSDTDEWIEIKGFLKEESKIKMDEFISQGYKLTILFKKDIERITGVNCYQFLKAWKKKYGIL